MENSAVKGFTNTKKFGRGLLTFGNGCDRMNMYKSIMAYLGKLKDAKLGV